MKIKGAKQGENKIVTGVGIGIGIAILLSILMTAGLTSLVLNGKLAEQTSDAVVFGIRLAAVLLGGLIGTGISNEKVLPVIGSIGLGYLLILIAFGIAVYDGSFRGFGLGLLSVAAGVLIVTFVRLRRSAKPKHKVRLKK